MDNIQIRDKYIGMVLGDRYELLERVGAGGMAYVYRARDHKLDRHVAVKILKDDLAQDVEFRERFHDESKAVAMLSHTNIVNIYDVSSTTNPDYIVMEYVEGLTLKEYIQSRGGILSWKEALHFTTQITKALIHAHQKGVIHRDIKPHNIMLLHDSSVKVMDFGIARLTKKSDSLTRETLGSVHYISPEQARGSIVDHRTDIYSLGVVLYEMLTGRLPYEGETSVAIALQHIQSAPVPPRMINSDIPKGLEEIVQKMMAPDVSKRYMDSEALFRDLDTFRKHPETEFEYDEESFNAPGLKSEELVEVSPKVPATVERPRQIKTKVRSKEDFNSRYAQQRNEKYQEREEYSRARRRARKNTVWTGVLLTIIALIALFLLLWQTTLKEWFTGGEKIQVQIPDWVSGSYGNYDMIYANPEFQEYFEFTRVDEVSLDVPEGYIIKQSPEAGSMKIKGSDPIKVTLTVSAGENLIIMPDLYNTDYRAATVTLKQMGFEVDEPTYQVSDITRDFVISTSPEAGAARHPGDHVSMVVSLGPEIKTVIVPRVIDRTLEDAQSILESANLTPGDITTVEDWDREPGTVIYQSIPESEQVDEHTRIDLTVAIAPIIETPEPGAEEPTENPENQGGTNVETPSENGQTNEQTNGGQTNNESPLDDPNADVIPPPVEIPDYDDEDGPVF